MQMQHWAVNAKSLNSRNKLHTLFKCLTLLEGDHKSSNQRVNKVTTNNVNNILSLTNWRFIRFTCNWFHITLIRLQFDFLNNLWSQNTLVFSHTLLLNKVENKFESSHTLINNPLNDMTTIPLRFEIKYPRFVWDAIGTLETDAVDITLIFLCRLMQCYFNWMTQYFFSYM